jgi:hypothetical protein
MEDKPHYTVRKSKWCRTPPRKSPAVCSFRQEIESCYPTGSTARARLIMNVGCSPENGRNLSKLIVQMQIELSGSESYLQTSQLSRLACSWLFRGNVVFIHTLAVCSHSIMIAAFEWFANKQGSVDCDNSRLTSPYRLPRPCNCEESSNGGTQGMEEVSTVDWTSGRLMEGSLGAS